MKKQHYIFGSMLVATLALSINVAFAQDAAAVNTSAAVGAQVGTTKVGVKLSAAVEARVKDKADREIDRRISAVNTLSARVAEMKRLSDADKATLTTELKGHADALAALKVKIDADTDADTIKTDVKTITASYRIFMLIIPRDRVIASADRMDTTLALMSTAGAKLETRVGVAKVAGNDTTKLEAALTDMKAKLVDAQTNYNAAVSAVVPLVPDQGDQATIDKNNAAFKDAKAKMKVAMNDFVAARADIKTLVTGLKGMKVEATTSTDTTVTP